MLEMEREEIAIGEVGARNLADKLYGKNQNDVAFATNRYGHAKLERHV